MKDEEGGPGAAAPPLTVVAAGFWPSTPNAHSNAKAWTGGFQGIYKVYDVKASFDASVRFRSDMATSQLWKVQLHHYRKYLQLLAKTCKPCIIVSRMFMLAHHSARYGHILPVSKTEQPPLLPEALEPDKRPPNTRFPANPEWRGMRYVVDATAVPLRQC